MNAKFIIILILVIVGVFVISPINVFPSSLAENLNTNTETAFRDAEVYAVEVDKSYNVDKAETEQAITEEVIEMVNLSEKITSAGSSFVAAGVIGNLADTFQAQKQKGEQVVYHIDDFNPLFMTSNGTLMKLPVSSAPDTLYRVNRYWPVTNLRKVNDQLIYTIYSVQDKQEQVHSMYLFFEPLHPTENEAPEDSEFWWLTGHVFFMNKTLSADDFTSIRIGSSFDAVAEIDPAAVIQFPNASEPESSNSSLSTQTKSYQYLTDIKTYHYLTDGILCLTYQKKADGYTVSAIDFDKTFQSPYEDRTLPLVIDPADFALK